MKKLSVASNYVELNYTQIENIQDFFANIPLCWFAGFPLDFLRKVK